MLDNIIIGLIAIFLMCGLVFVMKKEELSLPIIKKLLIIAAASFLLLVFIPSTKQMAAIMIVPKIANSEKVQTIGNKVYDLAVEWMEELKPNKKESEVK
jgi:hypothetical protein